MSTHQQVIEVLTAYALDALEQDEAERVREHLEQCPICQAELASYAPVTERLASLSPSRAPAPDLRGRVLAAVEREAHPRQAVARPRLSMWVARWRLFAAALAVILLASQVWLVSQLLTLRAVVGQQEEIQSVLLSSDEPPIKLHSPDPNATAIGYFRLDDNLNTGLINYYNIPPPGPGQFYQCWFEFADAAPIAYERLPVQPDGHGLLVIWMPDTRPLRIRVTLETGSPATPTGPTIFLAKLPQQQTE